jgi:hypothetical protein
MCVPFGALFFGAHEETFSGRKFYLCVDNCHIWEALHFIIGCLPTKEVLGVWAGYHIDFIKTFTGFCSRPASSMVELQPSLPTHAPQGKRGFLYQLDFKLRQRLGFVRISLGVILATKAWNGTGVSLMPGGWRIPFFVSILLVLLSVWIRRSLKESPLYQQLKATKQISKNPFKESFYQPV